MVTKKDVIHVGTLADVGVDDAELEEFSVQFTKILDYFKVLDELPEEHPIPSETFNILREDIITPSLDSKSARKNAGEQEDGFFKAPRVM